MKILQVMASMVVCLVLATTAPARLIIDPEPVMSWEDLMNCKLVVLGKYDGHNGGTMGLKVERVLRSPKGKEAVKAGDVIDVSLQHWWSVETGPVGFQAMVKDAKGDGKPRLCYKVQMDNPGPLVPDPMLEKEESGVFFFPERTAELKRAGQLQPKVQADGWQEALDGKPIDLSFRLAQWIDEKVRKDALDELKKGRDAKVIAQLADTVASDARYWGRPKGMFSGYLAQGMLVALGDVKGDVYDVARARVEPALKNDPPWGAYRLAEVMAAVDSGRAMKEFETWIKKPPEDKKELRRVAVDGLGWVGTDAALELAIELIKDKDGEVGQLAIGSVRNLISGPSSPGPVYSMEQRAKLRAIARPKLVDTEPPATLSKQAAETYRWMVGNELRDER